MKKTLLSGVALTMALTLPTINVDASSENTNLNSDANVENVAFNYLDVDYQKLQVQESEDTFVFFDSLRDMELYLVHNIPTPTSSSNSFATMAAIGETLVGTEYKNYQWMGYSRFTPSWTKASSYVLNSNETETFTGTVSSKFGSVEAKFVRSYGVSTNIPANSSRYSRLAGWADLTIKRYRVSLPNLSTSYYKNKVTVRNNYVDVKYK